MLRYATVHLYLFRLEIFFSVLCWWVSIPQNINVETFRKLFLTVLREVLSRVWGQFESKYSWGYAKYITSSCVYKKSDLLRVRDKICFLIRQITKPEST